MDFNTRPHTDIVIAADTATPHSIDLERALTAEDNLSLAEERCLLVLVINHDVVSAIDQMVI